MQAINSDTGRFAEYKDLAATSGRDLTKEAYQRRQNIGYKGNRNSRQPRRLFGYSSDTNAKTFYLHYIATGEAKIMALFRTY